MPVDVPPRSGRTLVAPRLGLRDVGTWLHWLDEAFTTERSRLWHSRAVWHRVASARRHELSWMDAPSLATLELAALLHDVGRALDPENREPHAFVGARFLSDLGLHDVAPLVAHHSASLAEAAERGMSHLDIWQSDEASLAILTYVDRTTGPKGDSVTFEQRRTELLARYGDDAPQLRWFDASMPAARLGEQLFSRPTSLSA